MPLLTFVLVKILKAKVRVTGFSNFAFSEKKNLKAEADKMTRVRDDNVISFYGLCINAEKGICGLVMPFMSNGSLSQ